MKIKIALILAYPNSYFYNKRCHVAVMAIFIIIMLILILILILLIIKIK